MNPEDIKLSIFHNHQTYQSKAIALKEILRHIKYDNNLRQKTEWYRDRAAVVSRSYANSEVKEKVMPVFSVSVLFNGLGKQMSHVLQFTGLAMCDIDHVPSERMDEVLSLIQHDPHTIAAYITVSKEGIRVIFRYQRQQGGPVNGEVFPAAWTKGNEYYTQLTGVAYDKACNNANRLSGMAYDPDVYFNPDAEPFVVSDAEMLDANFAPGTESGKPRTEDPVGTHHAVPDAAWAIVQPMMARRELEYSPGHHHDYILHATYIFNRLGTPLEKLQEWASQEWADYNADERKRCIEWVYRNHCNQHGTWRSGKAAAKGRQHVMTTAEICNWIRQHGNEAIYNDVTDQTFIRHKDNPWMEVDDHIISTLRLEIEKETGMRANKGDIQDTLNSSFAKTIHPVRDYINSLQAWDHKDRVAQLADYIHVVPVQAGQTVDEARELLKNYDISNYFEVKDGTYFEVKYPEEAYDADVKHAEEIILRAEELIDNCKTHDDYIKLKDYIDTDSFATMYLMNLITGDHDANKYSTYYWIDSKTEKLYAGPAWDYDKCLGDEPLLDGYVNFFSYYKGYPERLADNEFFIQDVKAKLLSQAMPYLNGLLDGEIDRLKAHLAPSVKMDKIIWGDTVYHTNVDTGNYEESVKYLSYVIKNKGSFIEEAITNKDAYHTVYIDDNYHGRFCLIKDGECMPLELIENLKKVYGCTSFTFVNDAPFWEGYPIYYDLVIYTKGSSSSGTTTKINAPTNGADQNNNTITDNESNDTPYNSITLIDGSQFNFIAMLILLIFGLFTAMFLIFHALRKRSRRRKDSTK